MISTIWTSVINFFDWKSQEVQEDLYSKFEKDVESGKKRKKEVEIWSESKRNKAYPRTYEEEEEVYNSRCALIRSLVGWHVNRLINDLVEATPRTTEMELMTTNLVGHVTPQKNMEEILRHLENEEISRIGVVGNAGVGKTAIMGHIHNRILENTTSPTTPFNHVYWLPISGEDFDIREMQDRVADAIGVHLPHERGEMHRAARLHEALLQKRSKSLLVLDGVSKHFPIDKVGIPTMRGGCKLILASRSLKVCQRMGCTKIIMLDSLLSEEAEELFMEKLWRRTPLPLELEPIAKQIVKECDGLPRKILNAAEKLIGDQDDIHRWRNVLYKENESNHGLTD